VGNQDPWILHLAVNLSRTAFEKTNKMVDGQEPGMPLAQDHPWIQVQAANLANLTLAITVMIFFSTGPLHDPCG
jgi:hypothetical protein